MRQEHISSLSVENFPCVDFLRRCSGASCCTGLNCRTEKGKQWRWKQWRGTVRGFSCKDPTLDVNTGLEMSESLWSTKMEQECMQRFEMKRLRSDRDRKNSEVQTQTQLVGLRCGHERVQERSSMGS